MNTLQYLCDVANGKRRQWFNVSVKATALFRDWVQDWHASKTLEEVLDLWEMGHIVDDCIRVQTKCAGKRLDIEKVLPNSPWTDDGLTESGSINDELLYLVLSFLTAPECERMRLCPACEEWFIAARLSQKYCGSQCGRRVSSRRIVVSSNAKKRSERIKACRNAYATYCRKGKKPRESATEYVFKEANRNLHPDYKFGGPKGRVNFITRNAKAIGIPLT
jgi:hypothetical protein